MENCHQKLSRDQGMFPLRKTCVLYALFSLNITLQTMHACMFVAWRFMHLLSLFLMSGRWKVQQFKISAFFAF